MSKTGNTKSMILSLIESKERTLSEISQELGLAPSTVSQHLDELENDGRIVLVENPHIRKWKYYKLANYNKVNVVGGKMIDRKVWYGLGALAIVVAIVALLQFSALGYAHVPIRLTDPPHVPSGTSSLVIGYSSVAAHLSGSSNSSGWISASQSGTLDLMTLLNVSQTIAGASIPNNSKIDMVRFKINYAKITINKTTYNVTVPSSQVTAHVDAGSRVNSSSGVLLELSPTVASIFTQNSTIFVMVPSLKAIVVGQKNVTVNLGERKALTKAENDELTNIEPAITISSANLAVSQNVTSLSVTVKNTGNKTAQIKHIILFGNESATFVGQTSASIANSIGKINTQDRPSVPETNQQDQMAKDDGNAKGIFDGSAMVVGAKGFNATSRNGSISHQDNQDNFGSLNQSQAKINNEDNQTQIGQQASKNETEIENEMPSDQVVRTIQHIGTVNFLVGENTTSLFLPSSAHQLGKNDSVEKQFEEGSYLIAPGASATFTFSSTMWMGDGHIKISPIKGSSYRIVVVGEEDATSSKNVTAN